MCQLPGKAMSCRVGELHWLPGLCTCAVCTTHEYMPHGTGEHESMCTANPCLLVGESAHANAGSLSFSQLTTSVTFTGQLTRLATENHDCWPGQSTDGTSLGVSAHASFERTVQMHLHSDIPLNALLMPNRLAAACSRPLVNTITYAVATADTQSSLLVQLAVAQTFATPVTAALTGLAIGAKIAGATDLAGSLAIRAGIALGRNVGDRIAWGSAHSHYNPIKSAGCSKEVYFLGAK